MVCVRLFLSFLMIGFTSFGGLSMVPLINEQMIVNGWMTAGEVSDIIAIAEMTPGPLALNCAAFAGMRTAGITGALAASLGVLLPSLSLCLVAAAFLARFKSVKVLQNMLYGIRPVCVGIIAGVCVKLSLTNYAGALYGLSPVNLLIGAVAFSLLYFLKWSAPKAIVVSAVLGIVLHSFL